MTKLHPNDGLHIVTEPFSKTRRVTEAPERRSIERTSDSTPLPNTSIQQNWEMVAILEFCGLQLRGVLLLRLQHLGQMPRRLSLSEVFHNDDKHRIRRSKMKGRIKNARLRMEHRFHFFVNGELWS
jgi:hypothetical protein